MALATRAFIEVRLCNEHQLQTKRFHGLQLSFWNRLGNCEHLCEPPREASSFLQCYGKPGHPLSFSRYLFLKLSRWTFKSEYRSLGSIFIPVLKTLNQIGIICELAEPVRHDHLSFPVTLCPGSYFLPWVDTIIRFARTAFST